MPETLTVDELQSASVSQPTADADYDIDTIGIEFEYPIAADPENVPFGSAESSGDLFDWAGGYGDWRLDNDVPNGNMTRDHVGAEITSAPLDLHTNAPEIWYLDTIAEAEAAGYPFAARGRSMHSTNFGQHYHISEATDEQARFLWEISQEDWFRLFVCSSITSESADPWRHGGVSQRELRGEREMEQGYMVNSYSDPGRFEWRLPEPGLPEHFAMVMHFLRLLEVDGTEAAWDYAYERVHEGDERLTAVQQFHYFNETVDDYKEIATGQGEQRRTRTDPEVAELVFDILE